VTTDFVREYTELASVRELADAYVVDFELPVGVVTVCVVKPAPPTEKGSMQ
jgi:hypothetical protein